MPSFDLWGFKFYFYSNEFVIRDEKLEPVHIHVVKGSEMVKDAPKWWVGFNKCELADENIDFKKFGIKNSDLATIEKIICDNSNIIIDMWLDFFKGYNIEIKNNLK